MDLKKKVKPSKLKPRVSVDRPAESFEAEDHASQPLLDRDFLRRRIKNLPLMPGVYLMKDGSGTVIYVGKALSLRKRVSSYFHSKHLSGRTEQMVSLIRDISYIQTHSEAEALIYENSLIKQLDPKFNIALKDGKSYPMLKLTTSEHFPRLLVTRRREDDGSLYYGPYSDATLLREALESLKLLFPLRTCRKMGKRPCLNYHIKQCSAPCAGKITEAEYMDTVEALKLFLEGKQSSLIEFLTTRMMAAAALERFELANDIKRRIETLTGMKEKSIRYSPSMDLEELQRILSLERPIAVIEAFDISNLMGIDAVGSMVTFSAGRPKKSGYRHFAIGSVTGIDDYAMMREIVRRRYERVIREGIKLPDLIVIDGGKGHLNAACEELRKLDLSHIPIIGLAKEFEHIFLKDKSEPIVLPRESKTLHLLQRVRDEAHRFAITYHKKLKSKRLKRSELDFIKGVGLKRKHALIRHFGSLERIKAAEKSELLKVEGIDEWSANNIIAYFKGSKINTIR